MEGKDDVDVVVERGFNILEKRKKAPYSKKEAVIELM